MPKQILEISTFLSGVVGNADPGDIPVDAAVYQENIDPLTERGVLKGIPYDTGATAGFSDDIVKGEWINNPGQKDLVYIDSGNVLRMKPDWYNTPDADPISSNNTGATCIEIHNKEAHVGRGTGSTARFVGYIPGLTGAWNETADLVAAGVSWDGTSSFTNKVAVQNIAVEKHKLFFGYSLIFDGSQETDLVTGLASQQVSSTHTETNSNLTAPHSQTVNTGTDDEFVVHFPTGQASIDLPAILRDWTIKLTKAAFVKDAGTLPNRCTHINLYMAWSIRGDATTPDTPYFLMKTWTSDTASPLTVSLNWQTDVGPTYEASAGRPETLTETDVKYTLSAQMDGYHFVTNVSATGFATGEGQNYIFRSEPYQFDSFNWGKWYLRLPAAATAMAAFGGRLYAFDERHVYRINPQSMAIEDMTTGIGCIDDNSVIVTDYGMFFCDTNNIYWHDGNEIRPIGDRVLVNEWRPNAGWLAQDFTSGPFVNYDSKRHTVLVSTQNSSDEFYHFAYNIRQEKWDYWNLAYDGGLNPALYGVIQGLEGELILSADSGGAPYSAALLTHASTVRDFRWVSKYISPGGPTAMHKFYEVVAIGEFTNPIGSKVTLRYGTKLPLVRYEDSATGWTVASVIEDEAGKRIRWKLNAGGTNANDPYDKARGIMLDIYGQAGENIHSIGIYYRVLPNTAEANA